MTTADLPLERIKELYDLDLSLVEKISEGFLSENYVLANGGIQYFLKKHRHTNSDRVESVCLAEQFFAEGNVPIILPFPTQQGECFFERAGSFYSLYPFVEGRRIERGKLTEAAAVSLGSTLAGLHRRGKDSALEISDRFGAWNTKKFLASAAMIENEIAKEKPLSAFGAMVLDSLRLKKEAILKDAIPYDQLRLPSNHLTHGDYFCDNVFFDHNDHITHIFDLEKTQYAPPLYELFRSLFVSFFSIPNQENLTLAKRYADAYLSAYPFPKDIVKDSLTAAYLKQIHSLWIEEEHYLKHNNRPDDLLPSQYACNQFYLRDREAIDAYLLG